MSLSSAAGPFGAAAAAQDTVDRVVRTAWYWQLRGREDRAAEAWSKVLVADPANSDALASIGRFKAHTGKADEARALLDRLRKANPSDPNAAMLARAIELGHSADAMLAEARRLAASDKLPQAVARYRDLFGGTVPPGVLALEYYSTLGGTEEGWEPARAGLEALTKKAGNEPQLRLALARHLTYRESSRREGLARLEALAEDPAVGAEADKNWRQALTWLPSTGDNQALLERFLARHPADAELRQRLDESRQAESRASTLQAGFAALQRADVKEADRQFRAAGGRAAGDPDTLAGLAIVALKREEFAQARELLLKVKELAPNRADLWEKPLRSASFWTLMREGAAAQRAGRFADAEAKFVAAAELSPNERRHADVALGHLLLEQNKPEKAEPALRRALDVWPENAEAMRAEVRALVGLGRIDEARTLNAALTRQDSAKALSSNWIDAEAARGRAQKLHRDGDFEGAGRELMAARQADPTNRWVLFDLGNLFLELSDYERAAEVCEKLLAAAPDMDSARLMKARIFAAQHETGSALQILEAFAPTRLDAATAALKKRLEFQLQADQAVARFSGAGKTAARRTLLELERQADYDPEREAVVALAWADVGEPERAARLMREAVKLAPLSQASPMRLQLAAILLKAGRDAEVAALLDELAASGPELNGEERSGLAELRIAYAVRRADRLRAGGDLTSAFAEINPLLQQHREDARLLCALGRLFQSSGDYAQANAVFGRVLQTDPDSMEAREGAIETALLLNAEDQGRRLADEGLKRAAQNPRMHLIAARLAERTGNDRRAIEDLRQAQMLVRHSTSATERLKIDRDADSSDILQAATRRFLATSDRRAVANGLSDEIDQELERVEARHRIEAQPGLEVRTRQGAPGLSQLSEVRLPVQASMPLAYTGRLRFRVTPTVLQAGTTQALDPSLGILLGTPLPTGSPGSLQQATGTELAIGYAYRGLEIEFGSTPLGFPTKSLVGSAGWHTQLGSLGLSAQVARRPVTDSLLSYAGTRDPVTGKLWGGVLANGGRLDLASISPTGTYYVYASYDALLGTAVAGNNRYGVGAGAELKLYDVADTSLVGGLSLAALGHDRNLRYFTLGQGGYFSPQKFLHAGVPVRWKHGESLTLDITAEPGLNWYREDASAYFPTDAGLQRAREAAIAGGLAQAWYPARNSLGFAFNLRSAVTYPIADGLKAVLSLGFHHAEDFQEFQAGLNVVWAFSGRVQRDSEME